MCVSKEKQTPFHLKIPFASSSLQFPLCTSDRYRGNKGLFHYIITTVICHKYLVVHEDINSMCKYLSAATRKESPSRGEDNGRSRMVEIRFGWRLRCHNRRSQGTEAYRARAVVSTTRRDAHERDMAKLDLRIEQSSYLCIFTVRSYLRARLRRDHNGTTSAWFSSRYQRNIVSEYDEKHRTGMK